MTGLHRRFAPMDYERTHLTLLIETETQYAHRCSRFDGFFCCPTSKSIKATLLIKLKNSWGSRPGESTPEPSVRHPSVNYFIVHTGRVQDGLDIFCRRTQPVKAPRSEKLCVCFSYSFSTPTGRRDDRSTMRHMGWEVFSEALPHLRGVPNDFVLLTVRCGWATTFWRFFNT